MAERVSQLNVSTMLVNTTAQALNLLSKDRCDLAVLWREHPTDDDLMFMVDQDIKSAGNLAVVDGYLYLHKSYSNLTETLKTAIRSMPQQAPLP